MGFGDEVHGRGDEGGDAEHIAAEDERSTRRRDDDGIGFRNREHACHDEHFADDERHHSARAVGEVSGRDVEGATEDDAGISAMVIVVNETPRWSVPNGRMAGMMSVGPAVANNTSTQSIAIWGDQTSRSGGRRGASSWWWARR